MQFEMIFCPVVRKKTYFVAIILIIAILIYGTVFADRYNYLNKNKFPMDKDTCYTDFDTFWLGEAKEIWLDDVTIEFSDSNTASLCENTLYLCNEEYTKAYNKHIDDPEFEFDIYSYLKFCDKIATSKDNKMIYNFDSKPDKGHLWLNQNSQNLSVVACSSFNMTDYNDIENPEVKVKFIWNYIKSSGSKGTKKRETRSIFEACGDGKIQKEKNEKCDDGNNNGKPSYCDCDCKEIKSKNSEIERCK